MPNVITPHISYHDGALHLDNKTYADTFAAVVRDAGLSVAAAGQGLVARADFVAGLGAYVGVYAYDTGAQGGHAYSFSPSEAVGNYPGDVHERRLRAMAELAAAETQIFIFDLTSHKSSVGD